MLNTKIAHSNDCEKNSVTNTSNLGPHILLQSFSGMAQVVQYNYVVHRILSPGVVV